MSRFEKIPTKLLLALAFILLASIVFLLRINQKKVDTVSAWWDETWTYRQAIDIGWTGSTLSDFQVSFDIGTSALINAGKMQSDCDDIRVTDQHGNLIPHWIEEGNPGCNSPDGDTKIWTKLPSLPSTGSTIYIYYGNSTASNTENGNNVFEFFDDFNDESLDTNKWEIYSCDSNATTTEENGYIRLVGGANASRPFLKIRNQMDKNISLHYRGQKENSSGSQIYGLIHWDGLGTGTYCTPNNGFYLYDGSTSLNLYRIIDGTPSSIGSTTSPTDTEWHNYQISYFNQNLSGNKDQTYYTSGSNAENYSTTYVAIAGREQSTYSRFDNVFVTKTATSTPTTTPQSEEVTPGPIAYWKFDEGVGGTAHDSAGNNNGSITGATWITEDLCISGKCLSFNGNDYINVNATSITYWTASLWAKTTSLPAVAGFFITKNNYAMDGSILSDGTIRLQTQSGNYIDSNTKVTDNNWHHYTFKYDGTSIFIYIDGLLDNSAAKSAITGSGAINIGRRQTDSNYYFTGFMDEVKIYPYARTADQIKNDFNLGFNVKIGHQPETAQVTPLKSKLIAHYKFDEGYGTTAKDSIGTNHATIDGSTWTSNGKSGKALLFEGADLVTSNLDYNNNDYSISAHIYPIATGDYKIIAGSSIGNNINDGLVLVNNNICFHEYSTQAQDVNKCDTGNLITLNTWHHVVLTYNNGTINLYHDGKIAHTDSYTTSNSSSSTIIGGNTSMLESRVFDGLIDEVKIYNYALTIDEVKQDYNQGFSAVMGQSSSNTGSTAPAGSSSQEYCIPGDASACSPPIAEWKFDEGVGTTVYDTSGNERHGVTINMNDSDWIQGKIGKGLNFSYTDNNYIEAANHLNTTDLPVTITSWVKWKGASTYSSGIINSDSHDSGYYYGFAMLVTKDGQISLQIGDGTNLPPGPAQRRSKSSVLTLTENEWVHVAGIIRGETDMSIYFNGIDIGGTYSGSGGSMVHCTTNCKTRIGVIDNYTYDLLYLNADLDHIKVFDTALTPAQIAWDYNRGAPVAHWKLDETSGTVAHDSSGNNLHGTLGTGDSAPTWVSGKLNNAASFGGNDFITTATATNLNIASANKSFSIALWAKTTGSSEYYLFDNYDGSPSVDISLRLDNGRVETLIMDGANNNGAPQYGSGFNDGIWHHILLTWDGAGKETVYVDGKQIGSKTSPLVTGSLESGSPFQIGTRPYAGSSCLSGLIDDVRIYNYALTNDQVKTLYNNGAVSFN